MNIILVRAYPTILKYDEYNVQEIGLLSALAKMNNQCSLVLCNGNQPDYTEILNIGMDNDIQILHYKCMNILKYGWFPDLFTKIDFADYDLIILEEYNQLINYQIIKRFPNKCIVYHGPYAEYVDKRNLIRSYSRIIRNKLFDLIYLRKLRGFGLKYVTKSNLAEEYLRRKGFKNISVAGVGLNLMNYSECDFAVAKNVSDKNNIRFLYVGKIEERKNTLFLFEVLHQLKTKGFNPLLTLVGNVDEAYLKVCKAKISELCLEPNVNYVGKKLQHELPEYYQSSDFFLFPTQYDIFGMVLLEAMYFGLPAVSTVNGGSVTLINNSVNGIVIDNLDVENWVDSISEAWSSDQYNNMRTAARNAVLENFTWDSIVKCFLGSESD